MKTLNVDQKKKLTQYLNTNSGFIITDKINNLQTLSLHVLSFILKLQAQLLIQAGKIFPATIITISVFIIFMALFIRALDIEDAAQNIVVQKHKAFLEKKLPFDAQGE